MKKHIALWSSALLLQACANIGSLGGGPVDEKPPLLIKSNITDTGFNSKEIILEFDEYVTLNNPEKNIQLMPAHSKIESRVVNKKVSIRISDTLKTNTTYSLHIKGGIQDNNAGNQFIWQKVFSTGPVRDSSYISVQTYIPEDIKHLKISIVPSGQINDSFKLFKPFYTLDADKSAIYEFKGLKRDLYDIWLYTDVNIDNKPDYYQPVQFLLNAQSDSSYTLSVIQWYKPFEVVNSITDGNYVKLKYTKTFDLLSVPNKTNITSKQFIYYNTDSAVIKLKGQKNTIQIKDTIKHIQILKDVHNQIQSSIKLYYDGKTYHLFYETPQCYTSTTEAETYVEHYIESNNKPEYIALLNQLDSTKDTIDLEQIVVNRATDKAYLKLVLNQKDSVRYELVVINASGKEVLYKNGFNTLVQFLDPGEYKIQIRPYNSKQNFNPFSTTNYAPVIYEKTLYLKASWEEILNINL